jgi:hypothetical protein
MQLQITETDVINYTYEWLNTAFKEIPKLDAVGFYKKNGDIRNLLIEEMEEFMYAPNLREKYNALADIRVVVLNFPFYAGIQSHEIIDYYDFISSERKTRNLLESVQELLSLVVNPTNAIYSKEVVVEILMLTRDIGFELDRIHNLNLSLLEEDYNTYRSNMTKFCKTEEEAIETVKLYIEGKHPNKFGTCIETLYEETGGEVWKYRIITPNGKIMKSVNFKDVNELS